MNCMAQKSDKILCRCLQLPFLFLLSITKTRQYYVSAPQNSYVNVLEPISECDIISIYGY